MQGSLPDWNDILTGLIRSFMDHKIIINNKWHLTMYDAGTFSSLPTSAIIALYLLKKKKKNDEQLPVDSENTF